MGYRLKPHEIQQFANSTNAVLDEDMEVYLKIEDCINEFGTNQELEGNAWTALKTQLMCHQAVLRGLSAIDKMMTYANAEYVSAAGTENLDQDEIEQSMEDLRTAIQVCGEERDLYEDMMSREKMNPMYPGGRPFIVSYYNKQILDLDQETRAAGEALAVLEEKKQNLFDIIKATEPVYEDVRTLNQSVVRGIQTLVGSWTGNGYSEIQDFSWAGPIDNAWNQITADAVAESLQSGENMEFLTYDEFEGLSEEEQQEYLNDIINLIYEKGPNLVLTVGTVLEIRIGPDMKFYYGVDGGGEWKEESNWEISRTIQEQQELLNEFSMNFGRYELQYQVPGTFGMKFEYVVKEDKTVEVEMGVDLKKASAKIEYSTETEIENYTITSMMGIEKMITDSDGWEKAPAKQPAPAIQIGFPSLDIPVPDTGDHTYFDDPITQFLFDLLNFLTGDSE